jgi:hypothetical protein
MILDVPLALHLVGTALLKELLPFAFQHTYRDAFRQALPAAAALEVLNIQRLQSLPPAIERLLHIIRCSVFQSDEYFFCLMSPVQALPSLTTLYVAFDP